MKEYPTDEELEFLINHLEKQELYAPKHMKEQILSKAFPEQTAEMFPTTGRRARPVQTFTYRLKIIAGMAAALIMLMIIPVADVSKDCGIEEQMADRERNRYTNEIFSEQTREMNQKFNAWFEQINSFQLGNLFNRENGGIYNED